MIRLNLNTEPYWMDLGRGVEVKVDPLTPGLWSACQYYAQGEVKKRVAACEEKKVSADIPPGLNMEDTNIRAGLVSEYMTQFLGVNAIIEWKGVRNEKGNATAPVCKETITALFNHFGIANAFFSKYTQVMDEILLEGNGSGPEQSGTSRKAAGPGIAKGVKGKTSRARKGR